MIQNRSISIKIQIEASSRQKRLHEIQIEASSKQKCLRMKTRQKRQKCLKTEASQNNFR
jgi:hypothetical protein